MNSCIQTEKKIQETNKGIRNPGATKVGSAAAGLETKFTMGPWMNERLLNFALLNEDYDSAKLEAVKSELIIRGRPIVKAVWSESRLVWLALEGCHQLRAAKELGLIPIIQVVENEPNRTLKSLGLDYRDGVTIDDILKEQHHMTILSFPMS